MSGKQVYIAKKLHDRRLQRALLQFFKPDNWFEVRQALIEAGRTDLIGNGCDCLIPPTHPRKRWKKRRRESQKAVEGDHYHTVANPAKGEKPGERGLNKGYRPGRKTQQRPPDLRKKPGK